MSHYSPRFNSGTMGSHWRRGGQQNPPGRFPPAHPNVFHGEIERLNNLLEMERAGRDQKLSHLETELEETKLQLKKQKALKETFINQAKEAKRELERLEKFSDPAVLNAAVTASKVHSEVKHMNKKSLQQDFEELKVAHLLSREAFVAEIQAERKKSAALQEQLNQLQTSFEELSSKHEADDALLRKEEERQKIHEERLREEQQLLENLRAEKDQMFQEMSQKIEFLQASEKHLQEELVQLRRSYEELNDKYERDVSTLKQNTERYQEELRDEKDANTEREKENLQLIKDLRAEKEELSQKLSGEITIRQKREKLMLHELDQVHGSYEELKGKYEKDIMEIQQQVETYEMKMKQEEIARSNREQKENIIQERKLSATQQLQKLQQQIKEERKVHLKKREEDKMSLDKLRAEKEELLQNLSEEITILQNREKQNLQELDQVQVSHQELKSRFETEIMNLQLEVETHQQRLKEEIKNHLKKTEKDKELLDTLRSEYAILQENKTTEIKFLQEKERSIQAELDEVNSLYQDLNCRYETDVTAIKHQADQYQQEISFLKNDLETARKDLLLADSLRAQEEDFLQKHLTGSKEMEENSGNQEHLVKVSSPEVSSEEKLSGEPLSGCSSESSEETKISSETVLEDLDHPDTETMKDGKKKKSRISFWKKVRNTLRWKKPKNKQNSEEHPEQA